jgi:hypothetical protein
MDRRTELEAALDLDPYDLATHAVLGDLLQQHGDPRGELAALHAGSTDRAVEIASYLFLDAHPELMPPGRPTLRWCGGYIQRAEVRREEATELLRHPSSRFLAELSIRNHIDLRATADRGVPFDLEPVIGVLGIKPRASLRSLEVVGENAKFGTVGDITPLSIGVPRLEQLSLVGHVEGERLDLPHLRRLALQSFRMQPATADLVSRSRWLSLVELELRPGACTYAVLDRLGRFLATASLPRLEALTIADTAGIERVLVPLMLSPLLRRLRKLVIRDADLTDHHVRILEGHAPAFAQLESFDVSCNQLSNEGVRRLRTISRRVIADHQGAARWLVNDR